MARLLGGKNPNRGHVYAPLFKLFVGGGLLLAPMVYVSSEWRLNGPSPVGDILLMGALALVFVLCLLAGYSAQTMRRR